MKRRDVIALAGRMAALVTLASPLMCAGTVRAQEKTEVEVHYDSTTNGITAHWVQRATLMPGGRLVESSVGSNQNGRRTDTSRNDVLGQGRWRVAGANALERVFTYPNHHQIIRVTVRGRACSAAISLRFKPGKSTYLITPMGGGAPYQSNRPQYTNVSCAIR